MYLRTEIAHFRMRREQHGAAAIGVGQQYGRPVRHVAPEARLVERIVDGEAPGMLIE
jgi:hypothetical protein